MSPGDEPVAERRRRKQHLFALIRLDFDDNGELLIARDGDTWFDFPNYGRVPEGVCGTKAYESQDEALQEAARLNELQKHKGSHYFVTLVRLVTREPQDPR